MGIEVAQSNAAWILEQAHLYDLSSIFLDLKVKIESALSKWLLRAMSGLAPSKYYSGSEDPAVASSRTKANMEESLDGGTEVIDGFSENSVSLETPVACGFLDEVQCASQALRLWRHSSKQKNAEAALRVGDYAFFGRGDFKRSKSKKEGTNEGSTTEPEEHAEALNAGAFSAQSLEPERVRTIDGSGKEFNIAELSWMAELFTTAMMTPRRLTYSFFQEQDAAGFLPAAIRSLLGFAGDPTAAARHYQTAADLRHPQALWNLGWMYQWGVGVPVRARFDVNILGKFPHPDQSLACEGGSTSSKTAL